MGELATRCPFCYATTVSTYDYESGWAKCYVCYRRFTENDELHDVRIELQGRAQTYDPDYSGNGHRSRVMRLWDRLFALLRGRG